MAGTSVSNCIFSDSDLSLSLSHTHTKPLTVTCNTVNSGCNGFASAGLWLKLMQNMSSYLNPCAMLAQVIKSKYVKNLIISVFYQEVLPLYRIFRKK